MISGLDDIESVVKCIRVGAEDYVSSPFDPVLLAARIDASLEAKRLREKEVLFIEQIQKEKQLSEQLVNVVIPIGISFMEERDLNRLLEQILLEAKKMTRADGGTIYLLADGRRLNFMILRNDTLNIAMGGTTGKAIPFPPLELYDPKTGAANHGQISCHVALAGESVNIPDAYNAEGFDFHGTRAFDQKTGYRSTSFLTVPLKNKAKKVIGVLQLINAIDPATRRVIPFDQTVQHGIESLSLIAAAALELTARPAAGAPATATAGAPVPAAPKVPPPPRPPPPPPPRPPGQ
ncbi:MAG: GAF domain-containing protein [Verrucomicrobia bacterium]|nr:GAF domain-containing protein [Verrucomicrobiota bacterium]